MFIYFRAKQYFIFLHFVKREGLFNIYTCFADDNIILIENLTISFVGKMIKEKLHWTGYNKLACFVSHLALPLNHNFMTDFIIVFKSSQDSQFTLTLTGTGFFQKCSRLL